MGKEWCEEEKLNPNMPIPGMKGLTFIQAIEQTAILEMVTICKMTTDNKIRALAPEDPELAFERATKKYLDQEPEGLEEEQQLIQPVSAAEASQYQEQYRRMTRQVGKPRA